MQKFVIWGYTAQLEMSVTNRHITTVKLDIKPLPQVTLS